MNDYKILICYSGGQAFIGRAIGKEEGIMVLEEPRIIIQQRNDKGSPSIDFELIAGLPQEVTFLQVEAVGIPDKLIANWYIEEISESSLATANPINQLAS
ncbi:MAG TPA: hypothetical protein PKJ25_04210 [Smithellaceae bacterium]|jgi:hypothetical protein|nr:hypothetical protein [Smithellaceae bacterium]HPY34697.1 hypothetical protein [Smithellaceae bacterium]